MIRWLNSIPVALKPIPSKDFYEMSPTAAEIVDY